jgi:hypothetical protein
MSKVPMARTLNVGLLLTRPYKRKLSDEITGSRQRRFFALQASEESSSALASAINVNSKFDPTKDLLLVVNLSAKGYTVLGVNGDADIDAIMALR